LALSAWQRGDTTLWITHPVFWALWLKYILQRPVRVDILTTKALRRELSETIMKEVVFA
jgi:hypothetical protein